MPPRYGTIDEAAIEALVQAFYGRARLDPELGPVFEAAVHDWEEHLRVIAGFWSSVMLASMRYRGDALAAHRRHPIRPEFFDRWLRLWGETADELFEPEPAEAFKARAARIGESLKLGLFFKP
jgi:hemoglobin